MESIYLIDFRKKDYPDSVFEEILCTSEFHLMIILEELVKSGFDDFMIERVNDYIEMKRGKYCESYKS